MARLQAIDIACPRCGESLPPVPVTATTAKSGVDGEITIHLTPCTDDLDWQASLLENYQDCFFIRQE